MKEKNLTEREIKDICEDLELRIKMYIKYINESRHYQYNAFIRDENGIPIFNNPFFMNDKDLKEAAAYYLIKEVRDINRLSSGDLKDIEYFIKYSFGLKPKKERKYKVGDIVKMNNPYPKSNYGLVITVHAGFALVSNAISDAKYCKLNEISHCINEEINRFKFELEKNGIRISDSGTHFEKIKKDPKVGDIVRNCRFVGILTDIKNNKGNVLTYVDREFTESLDELYLCSNREKEEFLKMLEDDNLMIGKDGIGIVRWMPKMGEKFWTITPVYSNDISLDPISSTRQNTHDECYKKCFSSKELAQQAIDNL